MHLLAARPGEISDGSEAVDLEQSPGDIVVLSAADTELAALAAAHDSLAEAFGDGPSLRLASLLHLGHNLSVDLYCDQVIQHARLVVLRLIGGRRYWRYGLEQVSGLCRERGIALAALPGDDQPDPDLDAAGTLDRQAAHRLWQYLVQGGAENMGQFLRHAASLTGHAIDWAEPVPLLRAGRHGDAVAAPGDARSRCALVFYRALAQGGATAPVDALSAALESRGLAVDPIFVSSLKDPVAAATLETLLAERPPAVILNATAFAVSRPGVDDGRGPFAGTDCPVFQVVFSGGAETAWRAGTAGLAPRDIAMNVALPEVDGRVLTRAVSFKAEARRHAATQCAIATYRPVPDRVDFVADLVAAWARLRATSASRRRVAIVLANYPNRDGRLGNGVGLDTPASLIEVVRGLGAAGYGVDGVPDDPAALIAHLAAGITNDLDALSAREVRETLALDMYAEAFAALPEAVRREVTERWGAPEDDPHVANGAFRLPLTRFGALVVGIQPARGYHVDPVATYHDPALVPPHAYLAFHVWLRRRFDAHAVVHLGKHGNLEWLPGKALALSDSCYPEVALGPLPNLYPFIVNDPGEGSQAKRRAAAVVIDHLTPPLARAETYGPLRRLEVLVDEYYEAAGLDPRRLPVLRDEILELVASSGLDRDVGIERGEDIDGALTKLDNHLCEIKELQIRDGLHVFARAPEGGRRAALLVALTRVPRPGGRPEDESLIRALARDLDLPSRFDPLDCGLAAPWSGQMPELLAALSQDAWRTQGDTVERLELLAEALVAGRRAPAPDWDRTRAVLAWIDTRLGPAVDGCGAAEIDGLLAGLDGRFVAPGPSGAPSRGRPEVLPTGRNFFSVDTRAVPTPAAWHLGWKSAGLLIDRHAQEHGEWPRSVALSAWGTANMRTGGDDIAQGLALMGVKPRWDDGSGRVNGFEILPLDVLDRPRVDVTLRVSGFFRDAFPGLIDLFDSAARAVAALDEPAASNPIAAAVRADRRHLEDEGMSAEDAARRAGFRVFGAKPGAYGAGLQALIDEKGWSDEADLAAAYLAWGAFAYGSGAEGAPERALFEARLSGVEAVVHNQDNREHDLLDSDDYYQFEGGLSVTVRALSGRDPVVYHNDHSRPETPRVRTLREEIARTVRGRAANPKWIAGVMRHGYKGAFEMAATVDYLFAFAATTRVVEDHHFDQVYAAYLEDPPVSDFLERANPAALREMAERFQEAIARGLWRPRANSVHDRLAAIGRAAEEPR